MSWSKILVCVCVNVKVKVTHDKPARHRWETNVLFQPICNLSAMRGWVVSNMLQSRYPPEIIGTHGTGDGPMYLFVDVQNDFTMQKKTGRTETNVSLTQDATNNHKCITCSGFHKQPQILHITWGLMITPTLGLLQHLLLKPHQQFFTLC